jgi:3-methylfumaryl-CoA hydratase
VLISSKTRGAVKAQHARKKVALARAARNKVATRRERQARVEEMDIAALTADLRRAIGGRKVTEDHIAPSLVERLAVTLECDGAPPRGGEALPPGWHTIFCLQTPTRGELGDDGLPRHYDLIPEVPMQRRLFGGARMEFHAPLVVGGPVRCESELADVKVRSTRNAHLAIATLRHRFSGSAGLAVVEEQDIVHMEPIVTGKSGGAEPGSGSGEDAAQPVPTWQRTLTPDVVTLFRFSALTFNSHRIHYDASYAERCEHLPGLAVQGKWIALQLLETARRATSGIAFKAYQYRSTRPIYAGSRCTFAVQLGDSGGDARMWAQDQAGAVVQTASLTFAQPVRG